MKKLNLGRKVLIAMTLAVTMIVTSVTAFAAAISTKSPYTNITYTHNSVFEDSLKVNVIDVSDVVSGQQNIDWNAVKASGVDAAIVRCGGTYFGESRGEDRFETYTDDYFVSKIKAAKEAGIMVGVYWFSQAISENEAKAEAQKTIDMVESAGVELDLPIFMDYEFATEGSIQSRIKTHLNNEQRSQMIEVWCGYIEDHGYEAGFYSNVDFYTNAINNADYISNNYIAWVAHFATSCAYDNTYHIWQYSEAGIVPGINNSNTDCNYWYIAPATVASKEKSIVNCTVTTNSVAYNANTNHTPKVTVFDGDTLLTEGTHYQVGYINNRNKGTGYAYIKGIGEYSDYQVLTFDISEMTGIGAEVGIASSAGYTFSTNYIKGIAPSTNVSTFTSKITINEGYTLKVYGSAGEKKSSDKVCTGDVLVAYDANGNEVGNVIIIVKGDSDGDGECKTSDLVAIRKHILKVQTLEGTRLQGLDVNCDGLSNSSDLVGIRKHILNISKIV